MDTDDLPVCTSMYICVPGPQGGHKRVLDPLELELQMAWSHRVGTENGSQVL